MPMDGNIEAPPVPEEDEGGPIAIPGPIPESCQRTYEACIKACEKECGKNSQACFDYCDCNRKKCVNPNDPCTNAKPACLLTPQPNPMAVGQ